MGKNKTSIRKYFRYLPYEVWVNFNGVPKNIDFAELWNLIEGIDTMTKTELNETYSAFKKCSGNKKHNVKDTDAEIFKKINRLKFEKYSL